MPVKAYDRVCLARAKGRPTAKNYIDRIFEDFFELHGDRLFADDRAVIGGVARLDGLPVTVIGTEKGESIEEKLSRNFGSANPEGYRKALRLMRSAEKFRRPIICFVDTSGAYCGIGAEERGQGSAIAANLVEMMGLRTPVITVMIGEGGSGGALALAVADEVWMLENAYYSVISPEGAASIIWKDAGKVAEACEHLKLTAGDLYSLNVIERVIPEDQGDFDGVFGDVKSLLAAAVKKYLAMEPEELLEHRYERFRKMGSTRK